jgi:phosphohistidine phosphatase
MKTLLILRHAKSRPRDPNLSDHDRPLDELGKCDALNMGKLIRYKDLIPDFIISSTALRAKTTAEIVAKECKYEGDTVLDHSLYEAKPKDYLAIIETLSERYSNILLVAHNPTIEETIQMLTDYSSDDEIVMPSCALAHLSLPIEKWSDLNNNSKQASNNKAQLIRIWRPEELEVS